ncbi:MAG: hypothetical protein A3C07_01975 [Candidatus Sungbacteria bacterium RIFCSPHIGHO2_02_FULL_47_11]|uniref:Uncharacterized protein n=1 Tax=Candidatus Sungbacteria bacterium RIFCSPHIGHO2_02_FULL_47_11 TaxID=1802270 RepID=A0A1G2KN33_9BACT|nr:MAG: hypothetical protein A3C07_01975 [Candidatus Sungbacteria bacterium RIFCSPHIGHO2_02_FULL_47_11]
MHGEKVEKNYGAFAILISVLSLCFTIGFSIYTYHKLLPLDRANVILTEPLIIKGDNGTIRVELTVKNIGRATAEDIKFTIYEFYDPRVENRCGNNPRNNPRFNDTLFSKLGGGVSATFGNIILNNPTVGNKDPGVETVLLSKLEYKDAITSTYSNTTVQWFGWHYLIGEKEAKAFTLVRGDLDNYTECLDVYEIPKT